MKNYGGSAGSGGYNFQAAVYAFVASKILNGTSLIGWFQNCEKEIPKKISSEVGSGGDDIRVFFESDTTLDIQVKKGLSKGPRLWTAIESIALHLHSSPNSYGVLLVDESTARTIRDVLRKDVERIGSSRQDDLSPVGIELCQILTNLKFRPADICSRLRIIPLDLSQSGPGRVEAITELKMQMIKPEEAPIAFTVLENDGHSQTAGRLSRTKDDLFNFLTKQFQLKSQRQSIAEIKLEFLAWLKTFHATFEIPHLHLTFPIEGAWIKLSSLKQDSEKSTGTLAEEFKRYHEWYRLDKIGDADKQVDLFTVLDSEQFAIVVGGPGSGKSTLARRIVHTCSNRNLVAFRVPLAHTAKRIKSGETLEEAMNALVLGSFPKHSAQITDASLIFPDVLIADGLDETGDMRSTVAEELRKWASAEGKRRLIVTTRPVGHNPNWFPDWPHYEIQPMRQDDVFSFASLVLNELKKKDPSLSVETFRQQLELSPNASLACRNPHMLTLILALYVKGESVSGSRFEIFRRVCRLALRTVPLDTIPTDQIPESHSWAVLETLAWESHASPLPDDEEILERVSIRLSSELNLPKLKANQDSHEIIEFLCQRRLLEKLTVFSDSTITFVHMALAEFCVAKFLSELPERELSTMLEPRIDSYQFRQVIPLLGSTSRADLVVNILIEHGNRNIMSIAPVLAAEMLSEGTLCPDSYEIVANSLTKRLTSSVPDLVFEACESLHPMVSESNPLIGEVVFGLMSHSQHWTRVAAASLALKAGQNFVNADKLLKMYTTVRDSEFTSSRRRKLTFKFWNFKKELLIDGADYILENCGAEGLDVIIQAYSEGHHSQEVSRHLESKLKVILSESKLEEIRPEWKRKLESLNFDAFNGSRENLALNAFLTLTKEALIECGQLLPSESRGDENHLGTLLRAIDFWNTRSTPDYSLARKDERASVKALILAVVVAASLDRTKILTAIELILAHEDPYRSLVETCYDKGKEASEVDLNWQRVLDLQLDRETLINAIENQSWFVAKTAWAILDNCFLSVNLGELAISRIPNAKGHALLIYADLSLISLPEENCIDPILSRLEANLAPDCCEILVHFSKLLDSEYSYRYMLILRQALSSREFELVTSAVSVLNSSDLVEELKDTFLEELDWWANKGPMEPKGGGVVPHSSAAELVRLGFSKSWLGSEELISFARSNRRDARDMAEELLCEVASKDDLLLKKLLIEMHHSRLSSRVLDTLSRKFGERCRLVLNEIVQLLKNDSRDYRIASVRALSDPWAPREEARSVLQNCLDDIDPSVRNEAMQAIRRLSQLKS